MSNNDNSLLNFLKTNSLFNQSPTKNSMRKSKSRSKDKSSNSKNTPTKSRDTFNDEEYRQNKLFAPPVQIKFNSQQPESYKTFAPVQSNNTLYSNNTHTPSSNTFETRFSSFQPLEQKRQNRTLGGLGEAPKYNQQRQGDVSYSNHASFQSARIESFQCLQNLGLKVKSQISNINSKIDNFNQKMYRTITNQFKSLRERVLLIFDEAFKESERYIREYMRAQEEVLTGDLMKMREILKTESTKIDEMKAQIEKPQWRKMAGEIIASELERKVEEMVKYSSQLNVGRWELGDLVGYRLKDLEKDLRGIVRLKRDT